MSEKELTIEAGKFYETRNGSKVEIFVKRGGFWVGCVYEGGTVMGDDWLDNGRYDDINGIDCELDIVAEWNEDDDWEDIDPTKITLAMLPVKCRFKGELKSVGGGGAGQAYKFCWDGDWTDGHLYGCLGLLGGYRYQCGDGVWWRQCQIRKEEK